MTTNDVIRVIRRRTTEVDVATSDWTNEDIVAYMRDALIRFQIKNLKGFVDLTIDADPNSETFGINPEATDAEGMILAYETAVDILTDTLQGRLLRGEMGVSWKSGLEEESSTVATQTYRSHIADLRREGNSLILGLGQATSATRPQ